MYTFSEHNKRRDLNRFDTDDFIISSLENAPSIDRGSNMDKLKGNCNSRKVVRSPPSVSIESETKRRRINVEDAFQDLSLYNNNTKHYVTFQEEEIIKNPDTKESKSCPLHEFGIDNFPLSISKRTRVNIDPIDARLEELIRLSRIRAMVETKKNEKIVKEKRAVQLYSHISADVNMEPAAGLVTRDDFHLSPTQQINIKSSHETIKKSQKVVDLRDSSTCMYVSKSNFDNINNMKRSTSIPREMKYKKEIRNNSVLSSDMIL